MSHIQARLVLVASHVETRIACLVASQARGNMLAQVVFAEEFVVSVSFLSVLDLLLVQQFGSLREGLLQREESGLAVEELCQRFARSLAVEDERVIACSR